MLASVPFWRRACAALRQQWHSASAHLPSQIRVETAFIRNQPEGTAGFNLNEKPDAYSLGAGEPGSQPV
jgi:hypothetical protein